MRLVRSRPWLFLLGAIVGFVMVLVGPSLSTKPLTVYRSSAKVLITPNSTGSVDPGVKTWFVDESTIRVLLSSQDLLDIVIESVGSKLSWLELRDRIALEILSKGGTVSLIEISVTGVKPEETRVLCQVLCEKFIQYIQQLSAAEHDKTVAYLERERRNVEREMARSQKRLLNLGYFPNGSGRSNPVDDAWVELQNKRGILERDAALAQAEVEQLSMGVIDGPQGIQGDQNRSVLSDSLAKEQLKLAELRQVYTERSLQVKEQLLKLEKIQAVQEAEQERVFDARTRAARRKSEKISALLAQTEARIKDIERKRPGPEKQFEYANEDRQMAMWQESFLAITRQLYTARTLQQSSRREGAFTVVEKPQPGRMVSGQVVAGSLGGRLAMAIPVSLVLGLALVVGADYLSSSMRLEPRIEEALGLPIIGSIPSLPEDSSDGWNTMKKNLKRATLTLEDRSIQ